MFQGMADRLAEPRGLNYGDASVGHGGHEHDIADIGSVLAKAVSHEEARYPLVTQVPPALAVPHCIDTTSSTHRSLSLRAGSSKMRSTS